MVTIARQKFDEYTVALAEQTAEMREGLKKVGYTVPLPCAAGPLMRTLIKLGMEPLNTNQVEQYKQSKCKKYISSRNRFKLISYTICTAVSTWLYLWMTDPYGRYIAPVILFGISIAACTGVASDMTNKKVSRKWSRCEISRYNQLIPAHILSKVLEINKALPDASFHVDCLVKEVEYEVPIRLQDPFLLVTLGQESFYLDVWEEPEFELKVR